MDLVRDVASKIVRIDELNSENDRLREIIAHDYQNNFNSSTICNTDAEFNASNKSCDSVRIVPSQQIDDIDPYSNNLY